MDWNERHDELPPYLGGKLKLSDYQGWTNWETWNTALMMNNERETNEMARQLVERGASLEQFRDWLIQTVIGPENERAIEDAKEWNSIPEEERLDYNYEDFKNKHGDDPQAMDLLHGLSGGPDVSDSEPTIIDPELVNWDEIYQHIQDEFAENDNWEQSQQQARDMGLGWATNGGDNHDKMRDAIYRYHGAIPKEEMSGAKRDDPRAYYNRNHTLTPEEFVQTNPNWDNYIEPASRVPIWSIMRERHPDLPNSERDKMYDWNDPEIRQHLEADPRYQDIMQNGYTQRLHDYADNLIYAITHGHQHPHIPVMQQALGSRGYTPEQIQNIMRQRWQWNSRTQQWEDLQAQPKAPTSWLDSPNPNSELDQPGTLTLPETWSKVAANTQALFRCKQCGRMEWTQLQGYRRDPQGQMQFRPQPICHYKPMQFVQGERRASESWKQKYNYRAADPDAKRTCNTCSAFIGGKCHMFYQSNVEPEMVCDEWSSVWKPKTAMQNPYFWNGQTVMTPDGMGRIYRVRWYEEGEKPGYWYRVVLDNPEGILGSPGGWYHEDDLSHPDIPRQDWREANAKTADAGLDASSDNWWGPQSVNKFDVDVPGEAPGMGDPSMLPGSENTLIKNPCYCDVGPTTPHEWTGSCENGKRPTMEREAGQDGDLPPGLRFEVDPDTSTDNGDPAYACFAYVGDQLVGVLRCYDTDADRDLITSVNVLPEYQRRGIATAMLEYLRSQGYNPRHDWDGISPEGRAWAVKSGSVRIARATMYHVAPSKFRSLIMRDGLRANSSYYIPTADPRIENADSRYVHDVLFLMDTPDMAEAFGNRYKWQHDLNMDIWAVDVTDLPLQRDYLDYAFGPTRPYFVAADIPPDRVHLLYSFQVKPVDWEEVPSTEGWQGWRNQLGLPQGQMEGIQPGNWTPYRPTIYRPDSVFARTAADNVPGMPQQDAGEWHDMPIHDNGFDRGYLDHPDNWVWWDGHVGWGGEHHEIARRLGQELGHDGQTINYVSNTLARNGLPEQHAVAMGTLRQGYPQIYFSTRDRNAIWDDVARSNQGRTSDDADPYPSNYTPLSPMGGKSDMMAPISKLAGRTDDPNFDPTWPMAWEELSPRAQQVVAQNAHRIWDELENKAQNWGPLNCNAACTLWRRAFRNAGIDAQLVGGNYNPTYDPNVEHPGSSDHVWLMVDGKLFDPTAAQFNHLGPWGLEHYHEISGSTTPPWRREAMAERSGDPELDALIEQFMREEDQYLTGAGDPNRADYRKPEDSEGNCADVAEYLMLWLQQHGVDAHPYDGITHSGIPPTPEFNYHEAPIGGHSAVEVRMPSGTYMIDFTASQFGYKEFPMVQRLDSGQWQRSF